MYLFIISIAHFMVYWFKRKKQTSSYVIVFFYFVILVKEICDEILNKENLQVLRLEGNTISPEAAEELGKVLVKHPEFERFIGNDIFTGRLKDEIPLALVRLNLLSTIYLGAYTKFVFLWIKWKRKKSFLNYLFFKWSA